MEELKKYLDLAERLGREAGELCLRLQGELGDVKYKSVKDVVTVADVGSEKLTAVLEPLEETDLPVGLTVYVTDEKE